MKPKISSKGDIKDILENTINQNLDDKDIFHLLHDRYLEHEILTEDIHSSQLTKQVIETYVNVIHDIQTRWIASCLTQ